MRSVSYTYADDLGGIQPGKDNNNYEYDEIGNLVKDKQEEIESIANRYDAFYNKVIRLLYSLHGFL